MIDFISMTGTEIKLPAWRLSLDVVEQEAEQHYNQKLICTPCVFGPGNVTVGWRFESKSTAIVIGYMTLITGQYRDYPYDFEYGVNVDVPISEMWTRIHKFKIRFISDKLEILKCK